MGIFNEIKQIFSSQKWVVEDMSSQKVVSEHGSQAEARFYALCYEDCDITEGKYIVNKYNVKPKN